MLLIQEHYVNIIGTQKNTISENLEIPDSILGKILTQA